MFSILGLAVFQLVFQKLFEYFALRRGQIISLVFVIDRQKPKLITA
jgi:hypothetical protein